MNPNILISCPIRNRDWILNKYLHNISLLDYPKEKIGFHFILNDSNDDSKKILIDWKKNNINNYRYINISEINFNYPKDIGEDGKGRDNLNSETPFVRRNYIYKSLSVLRNLILDCANLDDKCKYLFSIDSDILINNNIVNNLLNTKKDIIAGLISNGNNCYNFLPIKGDRKILPEEKMFEVKITGAIILISRKVFSNNQIRYSPMSSGEDAGFCETARRFGFKSYILQDMQEHIMNH